MDNSGEQNSEQSTLDGQYGLVMFFATVSSVCSLLLPILLTIWLKGDTVAAPNDQNPVLNNRTELFIGNSDSLTSEQLPHTVPYPSQADTLSSDSTSYSLQ